jgi:hypothetical protein
MKIKEKVDRLLKILLEKKPELVRVEQGKNDIIFSNCLEKADFRDYYEDLLEILLKHPKGSYEVVSIKSAYDLLYEVCKCGTIKCSLSDTAEQDLDYLIDELYNIYYCVPFHNKFGGDADREWLLRLN